MASVSIIVPIFNVATYLPACIESLRRQTMADFEVVLVDDDSTDDSPHIAQQASADDRRFTYVHQQNRGPGPGGGRNGGLAHASGEYLMFVDGDDVLPADALELLRRPMLHAPAIEMSSGRVQRLEGTRVRPSRLYDRSHRATATTTLRGSPSLVFDPAAWNKMFRRSHFDVAVGSYPEQILYEDMVASMTAFADARAVAVLNDVIYLWRIRQDQTSITQDHRSWRNHLDRFAELQRLDQLLTQRDLPDVKRWLHWKILSIDLAYSQRLMADLSVQDGQEFLDEVNALIDAIDPDPIAPLSSDVAQRLDVTRTGDIERCHTAFRLRPSRIRPDRRPVLDTGDRLRIAPELLTLTRRRDRDLTLALRLPSDLQNPTVVGTSAQHLPNDANTWEAPLQRIAGSVHRAILPHRAIARCSPETQLHVRGTLHGQTVTGEIERSDLHRALSDTPKISSANLPGLSYFFEDAQLHLWDGRDATTHLVSAQLAGRSLELTLRCREEAPALLALGLVHRDAQLAAPWHRTSTNGEVYQLADAEQLEPGRWAVATLLDVTDPLPAPLQMDPTIAGRFGPRTTTWRLTPGERGQAVVQRGFKPDHQRHLRQRLGRVQ